MPNVEATCAKQILHTRKTFGGMKKKNYLKKYNRSFHRKVERPNSATLEAYIKGNVRLIWKCDSVVIKKGTIFVLIIKKKNQNSSNSSNILFLFYSILFNVFIFKDMLVIDASSVSCPFFNIILCNYAFIIWICYGVASF